MNNSIYPSKDMVFDDNVIIELSKIARNRIKTVESLLSAIEENDLNKVAELGYKLLDGNKEYSELNGRDK